MAGCDPVKQTSIASIQGKDENAIDATAERDRRFKTALDHLQSILASSPAAEELASSWHGEQLHTEAVSGQTQSFTQTSTFGLRDLKRLLDTGKRVTAGQGRGIPASIVARTLKASWHHDGSWPLIGCDEDAQEDSVLSALPRSVHPSHLLLRPDGHKRAQMPAPPGPEFEIGLPPQRPDPEPEEAAQQYRARGIDVGPAPRGSGFEDW